MDKKSTVSLAKTSGSWLARTPTIEQEKINSNNKSTLGVLAKGLRLNQRFLIGGDANNRTKKLIATTNPPLASSPKVCAPANDLVGGDTNKRKKIHRWCPRQRFALLPTTLLVGTPTKEEYI